MAEQTKRVSRKRFKRRKLAKGFVPTEDDYQILLHAFRRRLIDTNHVRSLFPHRSPQKIGRRFTELFDHGWLDKIEGQSTTWKAGAGSRAHLAALSDKGAKALSDRFGLDLPASRRNLNNKRLKPTTLEHDREVVDFMVMATISARKHSEHVDFSDAYDILKDLPPRPNKSKPLAFQVPVTWQKKASRQGIEPDDILRLTYHGRERGRNIAPCMFELDREVETIEPGLDVQQNESFWRTSSILKKNVIYANAFKRKDFKVFGWSVFRVLYVTRTPGHMAEMQACERKYFSDGLLETQPGFTLYTNWEGIREQNGDVFGMPWENRIGKPVYIDGR